MPAASIGSILEVVFQAQIVILSFFRDVVCIAPVAFALYCRSHFKKYLYRWGPWTGRSRNTQADRSINSSDGYSYIHLNSHDLIIDAGGALLNVNLIYQRTLPLSQRTQLAAKNNYRPCWSFPLRSSSRAKKWPRTRYELVCIIDKRLLLYNAYR